MLYSGRKYEIWPEIGFLDPKKSLETLYWPSYTIWYDFTKSQKKSIFDPKNREKKFYFLDYAERGGPLIKTILAIDTLC